MPDSELEQLAEDAKTWNAKGVKYADSPEEKVVEKAERMLVLMHKEGVRTLYQAYRYVLSMQLPISEKDQDLAEA